MRPLMPHTRHGTSSTVWNPNLAESAPKIFFCITTIKNQSAAVSRIDHSGNTELNLAIRGSLATPDASEATIGIFLAHVANVNGDPANIPLKEAIFFASLRGVRLLLAAGAIPDKADDGDDPLIYTAARSPETWEIMEMLLDNGANTDASNGNGNTALMRAVVGGHLGLVEALVNREANLNLVDHIGNTAFTFSWISNHEHIVEDTVGCAVFDMTEQFFWNNQPRYTVLTRVFNVTLRILLQRGASVNRLNERGQSLLHSVVSRGRENIIRTHVENGADINPTDNRGVTPLMIAIASENRSILALLLDYQPDLTKASNNSFATPRHAYMSGSKPITGEGYGY